MEQLTPREPHRRGTMLTLRIPGRARAVVDALLAQGVHVDLRNPDIVRVAPVPLYTRFADVQQLVGLMHRTLVTP